jgi:tetratricopeptide (TPR) repeat protein
MKTMTQFSDRSATLLFQVGTEQSNGTPVRPKIGTDDGISNRGMNVLLIIFMVITMLISVVAAKAATNGDDALKVRILLRQSMLDVERGQYDAALLKLNAVFAADPENANVAYLIGTCHYHGTKNYQQAAFYYERASRSMTPDYLFWDLDERKAPVQTIFLMASAYEAAGDHGRAAVAYEKFLSLSGQDGLVSLSPRMRSMIRLELARAQQAASASITDAVAIEP